MSVRRRRLALRLSWLVAVAASAAASASTVGATPPNVRSASLTRFEASVLADVNAVRARHHLAGLRLSGPLTFAARAHSQQMAQDGYFAHDSADGSPFWRRIQGFYPASGFWSVGENLVWSSARVDAAGVLRRWLASPEHRRNLLSPLWREIGVSAVHAVGAPGVYRGLDVVIVTTDFGVRR